MVPRRLLAVALAAFGLGEAAYTERVCVYDGYWSGEAKSGPIFFYVGNESPVDEYVNGTGLMWQTAPDFGALLVFAEHRYFGESVPKLEGTQNCLAYLSSQEALADYAAVVEALRSGDGPLARWRTPSSPVIAFGGSYGGMLAAWFRMKYPSHVDASIAASAPIWGFPSERPALDGSAAQLTNAAGPAGGASELCAPNLKAAWVLLRDATKGSDPTGRTLLSKAMGLCEPLASPEDGVALSNYLQAPIFNLAEGSYPFPTDYITYATFNGTTAPLPAWPMRSFCEPVSRDFGVSLQGNVADVHFQVRAGRVIVDVDWDQTSGREYSSSDLETGGAMDLLAAVAKASQVWYNVTGTQHCLDWRQVPPTAVAELLEQRVAEQGVTSTEGVASPSGSSPTCAAVRLDEGLAWGALVCNEGMNLVNTALRGYGRDLFWPPTGAKNATMADIVPGSLSYCKSFEGMGLYGLPKEPDAWARWMDIAYGGKNIKSHTNIFFSNGDLDPWTAAGVAPPGPTPELPSVLISEGAHHVDLFFSTDEDPQSIREARRAEVNQIRSWLGAARASHAASPVPASEAYV